MISMTQAIRTTDKSSLELSTKRSDISVDDTERTSSTLFRIQRRQENRSHSKRSARKSLDSAEEALSLSKFYTKMSVGSSLQGPQVRRDPKILTRDIVPVKHRSPTPLPGYQKKRGQKSPKNGSGMDVQREIQLAELEKKVEDERIRKVAAERRASIFEKEIREKLKVIKQLQEQLARQRFEDHERNSFDRDSSESCPIKSSNLKKLRKNMIQLRMKEIEEENMNQMRQNSELKMEIDRLKIENQAYRDETQALKNQIFHLSQKTGEAMLDSKQRQIEHLRQRISESSTQREASLDTLLIQSQRNNLVLKNNITHLEMKIAFINRKKNEEIELIIKRKNKDLTSMRKKLFSLANQVVELRKQSTTNLKRLSFLSRTEPRNRIESECSLELSPEP